MNIFEQLGAMFSYRFMVNAFAAGALVAVCAALLGITLVLKRYSMMGDGLSHVGYGAMSLALALGWSPLYVSLPAVTLAAALLLRMGERQKRGDAVIAMISSGALAFGVIVTTLSGGMNIDVYQFMFGSILALSPDETLLCILLSVAVLALYLIFYRPIFSATFDEDFAKAAGLKTGQVKTIIAVLTALTIVVGMRMMGALLIASLTIFPALSAMCLCKSYRSVVVTAAAIALCSFLFGMTGSYLLAIPAGPSVVAANALAYGICQLIRKLSRR